MSDQIRRSARISKKQKEENPPSPPPGLRYLKDQGLLLKSSSTHRLALLSQDVPDTSESFLVNYLEEETNKLTYSIGQEITVNLEDVVKTIQLRKSGKFFRISQRMMISISQLLDFDSEKEASEIENFEDIQEEPEEIPVKRKKRTESKETKNKEIKERKEKNTLPKRQKIKKHMNEYKRGIFNPFVKESRNNEILYDPSEVGNFDCSVRISNLNFHRAAICKNNQLMDNLLKSEYKISNLMESWGPECNITPLERAFLCENEYFVKEMYKTLSNNSFRKAQEPISELNYVNTGEVSVQAYGVKTRKVQVSRGGREGNNALLCKSSTSDNMSYFISKAFLKHLIEKSVSIKMLKLLITLLPLTENTLGLCIGDAIRTGNKDLSQFLLHHFNHQGSFNFNFLHEEVLHSNPLSPFKSPSITKKPIENYLIAPLHVACINQDSTHLSSLLSNCDDINYPDQEGRKAVHYAAASLSTDCLKVLKAHGCNLNELDIAKVSPLMIAAMFDREKNVEFLVNNGVPLNFKAKDGRAPIHFAAQFGALKAFKNLVEAGCKIDLPGTDRKTPLMFAAIFGNFEIVLEILNRKGKDVKKDKCRRSALIWAVKNGHSDIVSLLLSRGSPFDEPDSSKNYPVHYAAAYGWLEILQLLLQSGASINVQNDWNISPLLISKLKFQNHIYTYLLKSTEANVNIKDEQGRSLVSRAILDISFSSFSSLDELNYLISAKNADVNTQDLAGLTPLHHLSRKALPWNLNNQHPEALHLKYQEVLLEAAYLLLNHGSNINACCAGGTTAVMYAIQAKNVPLAEVLIKKGADLTICPEPGGVFHYLLSFELKLFILCARITEDQIDLNVKNAQGRTLVSRMIDYLNEEVFEMIQKFLNGKKVDVAQVDFGGLSPLHHLCKKSKNVSFSQGLNEEEKEEILEKFKKIMEETAKILVFSGCDCNLIDKSGFPAVLYAIQMKNVHLVEVLVDIGADLNVFPNGGGIFHYLPSFDLECLNFTEKMLDLIPDDKSLKVLDNQGFPAFLKFVEFFADNYKGSVNIFQSHQNSNNFHQIFPIFIKILEKMITKGADPHAEVSKLLKYREPSLEAEKVSLIKNYEYCPKGKFSALNLLSGCNDLNFFEFFISLKLDINHQDFQGNSVLMNFYACGSRFVERLIDLGARIDTQNLLGDTLIHKVVERLDVRMLQVLIERKAQLNFRGSFGKTALGLAVERKNLQVVRMLLDHGADPNISDDQGSTPLHISFMQADSSSNASFDMESLLLLFKSDINSKDLKGRTPLHYSFIKLIKNNENLQTDPIEAVSSACSLKEINVNIQDYLLRTPLHYAAERGLTTSTMFLLSKGALLEVEDFQQNTPLGIAIKEGHANYAIMLVQQSAQVNKNVFVQQQRNSYFKHDESFLMSSRSCLVQGVYSMFKASIIQNFIGLAYLLLFNGYPYMLAMQDAMTQSKFALVKTLLAKVSENSELRKSNERGQNLFHSLAQFSSHSNKDLTIQICDQLLDRGVNLHHLDTFSRNPLHYSSMTENLDFSKFLLMQKVSFTAIDNDKMTPIAYTIKGNKIISSLESLKLFASFGASFQFKYLEGDLIQTPLLHAIKSSAPLEVIQLLLDHGSSLKDTGSPVNPVIFAIQGSRVNSSLSILELLSRYGCEFDCELIENGVKETPLVHAIKSNAPLEVIRFFLYQGAFLTETDSLGTSAFTYMVLRKNHPAVRAFADHQSLDLMQVDREGKTALMYAVLNNDIQVVKAILNAKKFKPENLTVTDNEGRHVLHYIVQPFPFGSFENKEMFEMVLSLHPQPLLPDQKGETIWTLAKNQRSGVLIQVISKIFPSLDEPFTKRKLSCYEDTSENVDFLQDAEEYVKLQQDAKEIQSIQRVPDPNGNFPEYFQVLDDYDCIMTKVDISSGPYSTFVFYRIQVLIDTNRGIFILFTRWGRIGEVGASQRTPFNEKEEIIKEFLKIFKAKTGNDWEKPFEKMKGKYFPMKLQKTQIKYRDFITQFENDNFDVAFEIVQAVQDFTSPNLFRNYFNSNLIDSQLMNFSNISRGSLLEAEKILNRLAEKIKEFEIENEVDRKIEILTGIQEMTSRFYELIPVNLDINSPVAPIVKLDELSPLFEKVFMLRDLEIASKIILAALYRQKEVSPFLYVLKAMEVSFQVVQMDSDEFRLIDKFMRQGKGRAQILSVFKVQRKGEAERIEEFKNVSHRKLLWHGTRTMNLISILKKGLKIAPPEAPSTGYMFGKGVYFADTFAKSFGYCGVGYSKSCFMLLCEVVLGKMYELSNSQYIEKLPDGFLSTKGIGYQSPDPQESITTSYGVEVPLGELRNISGSSYHLNYNEYIVYKESQIRIRYLLHLKNI